MQGNRVVARKRFGQHFLVDEAVIDAIVRAIAPAPDDIVVEIGPGAAALTAPLAARLNRLAVIELDRDLAARLRRQYPPEALHIVEADALTVDFAALGRTLGGAQTTTPDQRLRIVGNLPYNISTPLLFHLLAAAAHVHDQHFMLQREVIDRLVARPGSRDYGRLSVMLQARYRMVKLFDVPPDAFAPPPRVMSAVVRMTPLSDARPRPQNEALFSQLVTRAFAQRRKMLRRALGDWAARIPWEALDIPPTARAEDLSVAQFMRLSDAVGAALDTGILA